MNDEEIEAQIMAKIAGLPEHKKPDAIHELIGDALKQMPLSDIQEIRAEIAGQFDHSIAIVESTLNLIDGHLALRELMGDAA